MGQTPSLLSSSSSPCPQCRQPFPNQSKHCPSCGYANPIFLEAARYGVPSASRSSEDRALAVQEAGAEGMPCAYCAWPIRRGQMYCNECGQMQPAEDPSWTPRTRQANLQRRASEARERQRAEREQQQEVGSLGGRAEVPHPMGVEALVTPTGKATRKLEALCNAVFSLLTSPATNTLTGSHSRKPLVDIPRLRFLEQKLGRRPEYMLTAFHPTAILAVYRSMSLEHTLVPFPPPAQHLEAPCLTRLGLMQYIQHGILFDPHEAVRELRQLLADTPELPSPPAWLAAAQVHARVVPQGSKGLWLVEENMALSKPHPLAQAKQDRVLLELDKLGYRLPGTPSTPGGSRRARRRSATLAAAGVTHPPAEQDPAQSPYYANNPYAAWPWGYYPSPYPSPGYGYHPLPSPYLTPSANFAAQQQGGWAAYPPHPYSPPPGAGARLSPYRLSPNLPAQAELYGAGYARASPRRRALQVEEEDWDYRGYEDIR